MHVSSCDLIHCSLPQVQAVLLAAVVFAGIDLPSESFCREAGYCRSCALACMCVRLCDPTQLCVALRHVCFQGPPAPVCVDPDMIVFVIQVQVCVFCCCRHVASCPAWPLCFSVSVRAAMACMQVLLLWLEALSSYFVTTVYHSLVAPCETHSASRH